MQYVAVQWHHQSADDPIELFSEIDSARCEQRKVEVFADGRRSLAGDQGRSGNSKLGEVPLPLLAEIAADPQFSPREITREEFEAVWASATGTA